MERKPDTAEVEEAQALRFAWWASFIVTVALIALIGLARSAQATTLPASNPALAAFSFDEEEAEEEETEEEFESSECEFEEDEEAEEECEAAAEEEEEEAPRECVLASASATVTTSTRGNKIQLAIRYTAYSKGPIKVSYFLRGKKGPLSLGNDRSRLGTRGVIRDSVTLTPAQMKKALAAKNFTIQLRPDNAPGYCNQLLDRHLTVRHNSSGRLVWSDPGPTSTASRQG